MKKKKFLVNVVSLEITEIEIINKIVECTDSEIAVEIVKIKIEEEYPNKRFQYIATRLNEIERLHEKELTIREVMKTTYSIDNLRKTIKMYEEMLLKGLDFKTLCNLFAPYLIAYDHKLEECCVSKKINPEQEGKMHSHIIDVGFQWLPKNKRPFNLEMQNYQLWYEKINHLKDNNFRLIFKHCKDRSLQWNFVDFVVEVSDNIPDVPVRIETIVIENL